jgi:hypothetical protein
MRLNKILKRATATPSRARGGKGASKAPLRPVMTRGQLSLLFKIASVTIGLWAPLG